jgi:hypothetical protein
MKLFTSSQVSISNGENEIVLMLIFNDKYIENMLFLMKMYIDKF